jgi:CcmD family protein
LKTLALPGSKRLAGLLLGSIFALFFFQFAYAEGNSPEKAVEMADTFRSDGKIYVVVATIGIILVGVFLYLIRLDGKITKIENEN